MGRSDEPSSVGPNRLLRGKGVLGILEAAVGRVGVRLVGNLMWIGGLRRLMDVGMGESVLLGVIHDMRS